MSFRIGDVTIETPLALAPMAGVTDQAFRELCRAHGAGMTCTEMVSARALCYQDKKTRPLMRLGPDEHPAGIQLFGSDPVCIEEAAAIAAEAEAPDFIDLNMGCPVAKVAGNGEGSALMRDPERAGRLVEAARRGGKRPVTVKTRRGWDKSSCNVVEFARTLEAAGAAAVAVHGRTRTQMYAGEANWDCIREVKAAVRIPVIANGDVFCAEDAARILRCTGADAAMIGRGAFGNPWIFGQARALLAGEAVPPLPPLAARFSAALGQIERAAALKGERAACLEARRHLCWYLRGVPYASYYKQQIAALETLEDARRIARGVARDLRDAPDA